MNHPQPWDIEAWVEAGSPLSGESTDLARHVEGCARCAREIAWLRAERRLFAARAAGLELRAPAFDRIEQRLGAVEADHAAADEVDLAREPHELPWGGWARAAGAVAAATAALALVWGGPVGSPGGDRAERRVETPSEAPSESTWLDGEPDERRSGATNEPVASLPAEPACSGEDERSVTPPSCEETAQSWLSCEMPQTNAGDY